MHFLACIRSWPRCIFECVMTYKQHEQEIVLRMQRRERFDFSHELTSYTSPSAKPLNINSVLCYQRPSLKSSIQETHSICQQLQQAVRERNLLYRRKSTYNVILCLFKVYTSLKLPNGKIISQDIYFSIRHQWLLHSLSYAVHTSAARYCNWSQAKHDLMCSCSTGCVYSLVKLVQRTFAYL